MKWMKKRLSEHSTWVGLLLGLGTAIHPFVPEAQPVVEALLPVLGAFEVLRKEG